MATFQKRIAKNGTVSWRAQVRIKGHPTQSGTFPNKRLADDWAKESEIAIKNGKYFTTLKSKQYTLEELIDKYIREELPKKQNIRKDIYQQLDLWKSLIGKYALIAIKSEIITGALEKISAIPTPKGGKKKHATMNRYIAALSVVFSYAYRNLEWIELNPMSKITKYTEPNGRVKWIEMDEIKSLIAETKKSTNPMLYPVVLVALTTGARKNEVLNLKWADVDLEIGTATLHKTKNTERRVLTLLPPAIAVLRELKDACGNAEYVFHATRNTGEHHPANIRAAWYTALKNLGIQDFRFHDLRHTFASHFMMNGGKLSELSEILGHKDLKMTMRYAHLSNKYKREVVKNVMGEMFQGL